MNVEVLIKFWKITRNNVITFDINVRCVRYSSTPGVLFIYLKSYNQENNRKNLENHSNNKEPFEEERSLSVKSMMEMKITNFFVCNKTPINVSPSVQTESVIMVHDFSLFVLIDYNVVLIELYNKFPHFISAIKPTLFWKSFNFTEETM